MTAVLRDSQAAKSAFFGVARRTGVAALVRDSAWRGARLAILCYHGVSLDDEHEALPELYVPPDTLRRRFEHLRRERFAVLPLGEALDRLYAGRLPPRSVALTFDDGTRDFAERAVPLLRAFDMPATVYVTTYYAERGLPVFNTAGRYLLWRGRGRGAALEGLLPEDDGRGLSLDSPEARQAAWAAITRHADRAGLSAADKHALLGRIAERVGVDFAAFLSGGQFHIMTPEQLAGLPAGLVDLELHTHRHRTPRDEALFAREITDNRDSLARLPGGRAATHFCYPSGDYAAAFLPWLRDQGIRSATTCLPGLATRWSNPLLLPRFVDTSLTQDVSFEAWTDGTAQFLPRRRMFRIDESRP